MSSQPITRTVGPASLFGLCLLATMTFSLWLYWQVAEEIVWNQNTAAAAREVDHLLLQVHWKGIERPEGETWKEGTDELVEQFADKLGERGVEATFLYRPDAPRYSASGPGGPVNQFETDLIAQFMGEARPASVESGPSDKDRYYYYQPIYAKRECTGSCHVTAPPGGIFDVSTTDPLAEGDLMAVAKISLANHEMRETVRATWNQFLVIAIVTGSLVMIAFCIVIRYVTARNARLKE